MVSLKAVMSSEKNTEMEQNVFVRKETIKDEEETCNDTDGSHGRFCNTGRSVTRRCKKQELAYLREGKKMCRSANKELMKATDYKVQKYVKLNDYMNMTVELSQDYSITDEQIQEYIEYLLSMYPEYETTDKTTVENGDIVNIDYVGKSRRRGVQRRKRNRTASGNWFRIFLSMDSRMV